MVMLLKRAEVMSQQTTQDLPLERPAKQLHPETILLRLSGAKAAKIATGLQFGESQSARRNSNPWQMSATGNDRLTRHDRKHSLRGPPGGDRQSLKPKKSVCRLSGKRFVWVTGQDYWLLYK